MAKISDVQRALYTQRIQFYQSVIDDLLKQEKEMFEAAQKEKPEDAALKRFALAELMLDLCSIHVVQSGVSLAVLKIRNENALNEGRKALYRSVIYLEEIVTSFIDVPYSDYEEKVALLNSVDAATRYRLVRKLGFTIQLLENSYGDNTKWRWSFVDLEGRFATVAKNIFDMRNMIANIDPRSPVYEPTVYHLRIIKKLLNQAADRYREKYELSSHQADDFRLAILYLGALKRLHILLNESGEVEKIKKKSDAWQEKFDADVQKAKA
ncbi:MAG: hypothetical protein LBQ77_08275 [Treponema sp.]|jgi:hypothetical protein|nr:hypothetical protein [Treponema sp.]